MRPLTQEPHPRRRQLRDESRGDGGGLKRRQRRVVQRRAVDVSGKKKNKMPQGADRAGVSGIERGAPGTAAPTTSRSPRASAMVLENFMMKFGTAACAAESWVLLPARVVQWHVAERRWKRNCFVAIRIFRRGMLVLCMCAISVPVHVRHFRYQCNACCVSRRNFSGIDQ